MPTCEEDGTAMGRSCNLRASTATTMSGWDPINQCTVILRFDGTFESYCAGNHPAGLLIFRFHPGDMKEIQAHVNGGGCISFHWKKGFTTSLVDAHWFKS